MITPSERLEATIWMESTLPNAPPELREKFLTAVDEYYTQHPTVDRGPNILAILREDHAAFAQILRAMLPEDYSLVDVIEISPDARGR